MVVFFDTKYRIDNKIIMNVLMKKDDSVQPTYRGKDIYSICTQNANKEDIRMVKGYTGLIVDRKKYFNQFKWKLI